MVIELLQQHIVLTVIALPFAIVPIIFLIGQKNHNVRESLIIFASTLLVFAVLLVHDRFLLNSLKTYQLIELLPDIFIAFKVDALGLVFALVASFLWLVSTIYSIGYMRGNREKHQTAFYGCFALAIGCVMGIAFSANLITMFIFYELMTVLTYPLVTHSQSHEAQISGRKYLGILMGVSIFFFLPAIIWTYMLSDGMFVSGGVFEGKLAGIELGLLLFLFVYGVGKAALMPFHYWLPAAMVAPTPVSALLHAVAVVKAGVFCIVKIIIYIFGVDFLQGQIEENWLAGGYLVYLAGFTIIAASTVAIRQDNLKLRLAYSTVSQLSYVIIAAAALSYKSIIAAVFHIVAHAFAKITLFFAAGSIYTAHHKKNVSEFKGIGRKMPITMTAFTIGALSMIGVPPLVGFISKWYLFDGSFDNGNYFIILVMALSTMLNAMYFLPVIYNAFFAVEKGATKQDMAFSEAPVSILLALTITTLATILLFIYPYEFLSLAKMVALD